MPNNYIIGMNPDRKEVEDKKISNANKRIPEIVNSIQKETKNYKKGKYSFLKSYMIYGVFQLIKVKPFYSVTDQCIGCGLCEKTCPMGAVQLRDKKTKNGVVKRPQWSSKCVQCAGCINVCPKKAINFGKGTKKRGRYFNKEYLQELTKK